MRDAARAALTDTRRVVGLLRADDPATGRPGLDRLGELVGTARAAGLLVSSTVVGTPRPLDSDVDLSAFRIVQESLSNASGTRRARMRPSRSTTGPAHSPSRSPTAVPGTAPEAPPGGGHGLVGMRERVQLLGGTVQAGPRVGSGWSVVAELPYENRPPGPPAVRVVLAEGLVLFRDGLSRLLEASGIEVVDAVGNGPALLRALTAHRPDVAVVDVGLPPTCKDEG